MTQRSSTKRDGRCECICRLRGVELARSERETEAELTHKCSRSSRTGRIDVARGLQEIRCIRRVHDVVSVVRFVGQVKRLEG
jgi:hypothetical protein